MSTETRELVETLLQRNAAQWRNARNDVMRIAAALRKMVGDDRCAQLAPGLEQSLRELTQAVQAFEEAADSPEVIVATTGTTSSGKSTLANLLIGDVLMPKAVQEMSAGVVAIHHHEERRSLHIEATAGATWEVGDWTSITPVEVRSRLEEMMNAYRAMVASTPAASARVAPPRVTLHWPTRMGKAARSYGLPARARLTILDLPGLKHIDDKLNEQVFAEQARRSLCLVAYNSCETDPRKQGALLDEIVQQVKALQGSPARMLFVLNRIDVFRNDNDPVAGERRFTDAVTAQIRLAISAALPEYRETARALRPIPLSSEPALYAVLVQQGVTGEERDQLLKKLETEYRLLFDDAMMEGLPRSRAKWSDAQRELFLAAAQRESRLVEFEKHLSDHIGSHLPELILPPLVDRTGTCAQHAVNQLDALIRAFKVRKRKDGEKEKERLEELHGLLKREKREVLALLDPLGEALRQESDLGAQLYDAIQVLERRLGLAGSDGELGRLGPLVSALEDAVMVPLKKLAEVVYGVFGGGDYGSDSIIDGCANAAEFRNKLDALRASPYRSIYKTGGDLEGPDAERAASALKHFTKELSTLASELIARESALQSIRMRDTLAVCDEHLAARMEARGAEVADSLGFPGLRGRFLGRYELKTPSLPALRFESDPERWSRTRERSETHHRTVTRRTWWTLWIGETSEQVPYTVTVRDKYSGVTVGKLGDLLTSFQQSGDVTKVERYFRAWFREGLESFDSTLDARLAAGVAVYRTALLQRMKDLDAEVTTSVASFDSHEVDVRALAKRCEAYRDWRTPRPDAQSSPPVPRLES